MLWFVSYTILKTAISIAVNSMKICKLVSLLRWLYTVSALRFRTENAYINLSTETHTLLCTVRTIWNEGIFSVFSLHSIRNSASNEAWPKSTNPCAEFLGEHPSGIGDNMCALLTKSIYNKTCKAYLPIENDLQLRLMIINPAIR